MVATVPTRDRTEMSAPPASGSAPLAGTRRVRPCSSHAFPTRDGPLGRLSDARAAQLTPPCERDQRQPGVRWRQRTAARSEREGTAALQATRAVPGSRPLGPPLAVQETVLCCPRGPCSSGTVRAVPVVQQSFRRFLSGRAATHRIVGRGRSGHERKLEGAEVGRRAGVVTAVGRALTVKAGSSDPGMQRE